MKKIILGIFAACAITAFAQQPEHNVMIIHYNNGTEAKVKIENIEHLEFTNIDDLSGFEDAQNPTDKVDPDDPNNPDNPGGDDPTDNLPVPKVGDYFYSDGTWSDGGLISINPDGTGAVWSATKPAPTEGKTVIGIVFCTDPDRIADSEKERGYTHGYVIGCKNIVDPKKSNFALYPESVWFSSQYAYVNELVQVNKVCKIASSCYNNINGYTETQTLLDKNDPDYYYDDIPLFWYGTKAYSVKAPANTSGWFIPSVGQVWDCVANFCGGEVAQSLSGWRTSSSDFTYYCSNPNLSTSPYEQFAKVFELVPDADKDEMTIPDNGDIGKKTATINLATSTRYDDESRVIISLGMQGCTLVEGMAAWFDEETHGRPILAF